MIKKHQGLLKQLTNKALSGNLPALRMMFALYEQACAKAAEEQLRIARESNRTAEEMTDEELTEIIRRG